MTSSMWLIVASMLATVAGVVVQKIVESITGQQAKLLLDKERAKIVTENAQMRKHLVEKINLLEEKIERLQEENIALLKDSHKLELDYMYCKKQFDWLQKCNPALFENCPNFGLDIDNE